MALTSRGAAWEWLHSWWIALTLPLIAHPLAFFYIALRTGKLKWWLSGGIYLAILIAFLQTTDTKAPEGGVRPEWVDYIGYAYLVSWLGSIIHALLARKEFILLLDAKTEQARRNTERLKTQITTQHGLSQNRIDEVLIDFKESDMSVRLCQSLFGVLPFAPDFRYYFNVEGAVRRLKPDADAELITRAQKIAQGDEFASAIKTVRALDAVDGGLGIFTGFKNVYDHVKDKNRPRTFEADPQQAADAAAKAIGIAYMIGRLFPGGVGDKLAAFFELPSGKELALYYASIEIALPFTDNLLEGGANLVGTILEKNRAEMDKRLAEFAGGSSVVEAQSIVEKFQEQVSNALSQVKLYVDPLVAKVSGFAPQAMNVADSVSGGLATTIDLLPAYRLLGARLAAEAAALRAVRGEG
jgi:hypothetical protein